MAVGLAVFEGKHHRNLVGGLDHWCCVGAKEHFRLEADMPEIRGWEICKARLVVVVVVEMGEIGGHRRVDGVGIGNLSPLGPVDGCGVRVLGLSRLVSFHLFALFHGNFLPPRLSPPESGLSTRC